MMTICKRITCIYNRDEHCMQEECQRMICIDKDGRCTTFRDEYDMLVMDLESAKLHMQRAIENLEKYRKIGKAMFKDGRYFGGVK